MDQAMLKQHLAEADRHVAESADHVARQREIVAELANDGRDLKSAQALLMQFETMLAHHVAYRHRILTELVAMK